MKSLSRKMTKSIVIVDVPDLWYGSMYRTYIQKYQKDPGSISGRSVHDRDLCSGIWHRNAVETLRYVSLGLQRESPEL